jgi:hypothetical protein
MRQLANALAQDDLILGLGGSQNYSSFKLPKFSGETASSSATKGRGSGSKVVWRVETGFRYKRL